MLEAAPQGEKIIASWVRRLTRAATRDGRLSALEVDLEAAELDELELAGQIAETAMRAQMLGASDAELEADENTTIEVPKFARQLERPFVRRPFTEAIEDFDKRQVVTRDVFDEMAVEAKGRAFTVAGIAKADVVGVVHEELRASLAAGVDIRTFKAQLRERMELRGWLKPGPRKGPVPTKAGSPWHVETIYRNGVQASYARGRQKQMLQPAVLAARPFWEIVTANDARSRPEHKKLHGTVLPVTDPFWRSTGTPPWGHNCRCRVVTRSPKAAAKKGVSSGADISGVPDEGFGQPIQIPEPTIPAAEEVPLDVELAADKPDADGFVRSKPKHAKGTEGIHVEAFQEFHKKANADEVRELLPNIDRDSLMILEKSPLKRLQVQHSKSKKMRDTLGAYVQRKDRITGATSDHFLMINQGANVTTGLSPSTLGKWNFADPKSVAFNISETMATKKEATQAVLTHELGHHAMERLEDFATARARGLLAEIKAAYKKKLSAMRKQLAAARKSGAAGVDLPVVSRYASSNHAEWFAESYAAFVHRPEVLARIDPEGAKLVKKVIQFWQGQP